MRLLEDRPGLHGRVVWDGDLRHEGSAWSHNEFRGTQWNRIKKPQRRMYLENAYRVLLTRARQGMVVVVPKGAPDDRSRQSEFYDGTYEYLSAVGLRELDVSRR